MSALVKRRLVSVATSKMDGRHRSLRVTKKGTALLIQTDRQVDAHLEWVLSPLTREEQDALAHFFRELADGMGTPPCKARATEHIVRHQLRRATRALRLIHADFMGTKLGSPEWQDLANIKETGERKSISEIAAELQLSLSTTTTICSRLTKRGFTVSKRTPEDRRATSISLTKAGEDFIQHIEENMALRLCHALESVPPEHLRYEIQIFERVIEGREHTG
jgi:DNA-binding MarR family transcriptional regulator